MTVFSGWFIQTIISGMKREFMGFRKAMTGCPHRVVEELTVLDWRLIDIAVGIIEEFQSSIGYNSFRRELAKAANIRLTDAGWYITDVLTFDPVIDGEIVPVLSIGSCGGRYILSVTDAFKKYYDERETLGEKIKGGDQETGR